MTLPSGAAFPLTPGQKSLLGSPAGDQPQPLVQISCIDRSGPNPASVLAAWEQVRAHHQALQVGLRSDGEGGLLQFTAPEATAAFLEQDWREIGQAVDMQWGQFLATDLATTFDLARPPLWRVHCFRCPGGETRWVWTFHHALLDGQSFDRVIADWVAAFRGRVLAPTGLEAAALSQALNARRTAAMASGAARQHWRDWWTGSPGGTPLEPVFKDPAACPSGSPTASQVIELSATERSALIAKAAGNELTTSTYVLGAWAVVLTALTDGADVGCGVVRACRHLPSGRIDDAVGLLMNTVPLRFQPNRDTLVADWLASIRRQQVDLRTAELCTMDDIRADLAEPAAVTFPSTVLFDQADSADRLNQTWGQSEGLTFSVRRSAPQSPLLLIARSQPRFTLELVGREDRFDESFLRDVIRTCGTVLRQLIAAHEATTLGELQLVDPTAQPGSVSRLVGPTVPLPPTSRLQHPFETVAHRQPDLIAVHDGDEVVTYGELAARAESMARCLRNHGVRSDDLCAVLLPRSARFLAVVLGILKSGAAPLLLDADFPRPRLVRLLDQGRPVIVFADPALAAELAQSGSTHQTIDPNGREQSATPPAEEPPATGSPATDAPLAYAIFTSGSTGQPKLVGVEHRQAVNLIHHATTRIAVPADVACVPFIDSPAFDSCITQIFVTFAHGGTLVALSELGALRASPFFSRFTCLGCTPGQIGGLLRSNAFPPSARLVSTGGEVIPLPLIEHLAQQSALRRVINLYGPTEATGYCTTQIVFDREAGPATEPGSSAIGRTIGTPISNAVIEVVSPLGQPVPAGWPGDLWVSGTPVARGYLDRDRAASTHDPFDHDPALPAGRRYRTGDRVVLAPNGRLHYLGRRDHQLKIRGVRVEPAEVMARLLEHPGITEAYVSLRPATDELPPLLTAWVAPQSAPSPDELHRFASQHLPLPAVPAQWIHVSALPLNHAGKIDESRLPPPPGPPDAAPGSTLTTTERRLVALWPRRLGLPSPDPDAGFFAAGGDSLLATQWTTVIEEEFGRRLPDGTLAAHSTLRSLARWLDDAPRNETAATARPPNTTARIVPLADAGEAGHLLLFPGFDGNESFIEFYRPLARACRGVLAVDWFARPGLEALGNGPDLLPKLASSAADAIVQHYGDRRVRLFGHCAGAAVAWATAHALQERGHRGWDVVLCDPLLQEERRKYQVRIKWRHRAQFLHGIWTRLGNPQHGLRSTLIAYFRRPRRTDSTGTDCASPAGLLPYLQTLAGADFRPPLSADVLLLRDRRNRRINDLAGWQSRVRGRFDCQFFTPSKHHDAPPLADTIPPLLANRGRQTR